MVLFVTSVKLDVSVTAALVLEQATAVCAAERKFISVTLFVALKEAQATEGF